MPTTLLPNARFERGVLDTRRPATTPMTVHNGVEPRNGWL